MLKLYFNRFIIYRVERCVVKFYLNKTHIFRDLKIFALWLSDLHCKNLYIINSS